MKYRVSYLSKTARVDYFGETTEEDIRSAHFDLSGQEEFYDCKHMMLDVTQCSLKSSCGELDYRGRNRFGSFEDDPKIECRLYRRRPD